MLRKKMLSYISFEANTKINDMKKLLFLFFALLVIAGSCKKDDNNINPPVGVNFHEELQTIVDLNWTKFTDGRQNFPGGYALQILSPLGDFYVAAGDLSETNNQTRFRAGSTTKTFTAAAVMLLHQQGKLNINHFVTDLMPGSNEPYLPNTESFNIPFKDEITIKLLLQHRAGMFDVINQDIPDTVKQAYAGYRYRDYVEDSLGLTHTFTISETASVVAKNQLYNSRPGTEFHYSDTGMGLLGLIIERISGKRFDQFIADNFLAPLKLDNTSFPFEGEDVNLPEPFAGSYVYFQGETYDVTQYNVSINVAEGNLITTPLDLANWMKKLYTGKAGVNYENVKFYMMDCLPTFEGHQNYGLGTVYTSSLGYGHNGGIMGYFTAARYDPETDITFVIYTNVWDFDSLMYDSYTQILSMYAAVYEAKDLLMK
jgi:D-alanyl-D-alanine carboxypeptidase